MSAVKDPVLAEFGPLYRAGVSVGISARQLDEMEVWEIGEAFGMDDEEPVTATSGAPPRQYDPALLRERELARLQGRPVPPLPDLP